ncbi:MAG: CHAP domain-containing protein [Firmicutes bacterium]|nr:CHAP domain-containing protein [Bacillota bacterium]
MKTSFMKNLRTAMAIALSLAIGIAFMPLNTASVHAANFVTSGTVSGLAVSGVHSNSVKLKWKAYSGATGYQVYRADSKSGTYKRLFSTHKTSCVNDKNIKNGKTYYYKIRPYAKDSNKKVHFGKFSTIVSATPKAFNTGSKVTGLVVTDYDYSNIKMKWNSFSMASGYQVYRSDSKNGTYKRIFSTHKTSCVNDKNIKKGKTYYYKIRAYKKDSNGKVTYGQFSYIVAATATKFSEGKISGFKFSSRTYSSVEFIWNGYPKASGYEVYRSTEGKNGDYERIKTTTSTSIKRTGLTTNKTCYYKVRAYKKDSNGKRTYTKFTEAKPGTPRLNTPTITVVSGKDGVKASWGQVSGASGYELYRATSQNGDYSLLKKLSGTSYTDKSTTTNKAYYYKVRAYRTVDDSKKNGYFGSAKMGMKASISKVSGVSASSSSNCVALKWGAVSGASGYEVYRATGSNKSSYTNVGSATSAAFNDYNVATGLTYYYKIRAYKKVNGTKVYGDFSTVGFSRSAVVSTAVAWLGCKESNKSNKPIVDLYNSNMGTKFSYTTPWCAIFVSAVAIKSGTTSIIVRGSYCPSVINAYKNSKVSNYKYGAGANYVPKAGDVIFFDWNRNGVPDHTGLVASVSGNTIKTIEGNYSDAVGYRTFSVGYRYVQGYGLPNYDDANGILFTGKSKSSVGCGELAAMGIGTEPEGIEELGGEYDFVEQNVDENISEAEDVSDYDRMVYMVSKVRANAETEGIDCAETQYYAAFIYKLCVEEGLEASIMTVEDEDGVTHAWIEVCLDGTWYTVDASKESDQIAEFEPESTDVEGSIAEPDEEDLVDENAEDTDIIDPEMQEAEEADPEMQDAEASDSEVEDTEATDSETAEATE